MANSLLTVFLKFFDCTARTLTFATHVHVQQHERISSLFPRMRDVANLSDAAPIWVYEEVTPRMVNRVDTDLTFIDADLITGDILCFQVPDPSPAAQVPAFFEAWCERNNARNIPPDALPNLLKSMFYT